MNPVASMLKMHFRDKWTWIFIPWTILLFSFLINLIIGFSVNSSEEIYTGGLSSIYVYMFVLGLISLSQSFPFSIGLGVRRKDYFLGTTIFVTLLSIGVTLIIFLLSLTETVLIEGWGVGLHFFNLPFLNDYSAIERIGIYFVLMLNLFFLGFVIASIHRRFGRNGMYVFFTILFLASSIGTFVITLNQWWRDIFIWFTHHYASIFVWMVPVTAIYALVSYFLLRRSTI